ncbi:MAG: hypothetical protein GY850_10925 [bacterium]|nr:hypothetical protein [bacterium]
MKQYIIDELRDADFNSLKTYLAKHYEPAAMGGIFWVPLAGHLLTETQKAHQECQPHYLAVDLDENRLACELLVRTKSRMRCDCITYATEVQRNWLIALIDDIFNHLDIMT